MPRDTRSNGRQNRRDGTSQSSRIYSSSLSLIEKYRIVAKYKCPLEVKHIYTIIKIQITIWNLLSWYRESLIAFDLILKYYKNFATIPTSSFKLVLLYVLLFIC